MKGRLTPGATSSIVVSGAQVGPDPPVLLLQDVVVDPSAARGLEQGVVQEEEAGSRRVRAPGPSRGSTGSNGSRCSITRHITTASKAPSGSGGGRRRPGRKSGPPAAARALRRSAPRSGRRRRASPPAAATRRGDLAFAAADVEHPPRAGEVAFDQREDLLLVLGVGAVGELPLPPAGVLLPQRIGHAAILARGQQPRRRRRVDPVEPHALRLDEQADAGRRRDRLVDDQRRPDGRDGRATVAAAQTSRVRRQVLVADRFALVVHEEAHRSHGGRSSTRGDRGSPAIVAPSKSCPLTTSRTSPASTAASASVRSGANGRAVASGRIASVATICAASTTASTAGRPADHAVGHRGSAAWCARRRAMRTPRRGGRTRRRSASGRAARPPRRRHVRKTCRRARASAPCGTAAARAPPRARARVKRPPGARRRRQLVHDVGVPAADADGDRVPALATCRRGRPQAAWVRDTRSWSSGCPARSCGSPTAGCR